MTELIAKIQKQVVEYCIRNRNHIIGFDTMSDEDSDHIYNIAASVVMTRDNILSGGGFVKAIINNDLDAAITRADSVCIKAIALFVLVKNNFNTQD